MALSHDLLSQFARLVTKDNKNKVGDTVYGVIVADSKGNKYVKLDGSDQLTPLNDDERPVADSSTTKFNEGERVSVLIKNHTATVTGNISSPAARSGDVEELGDQVSKIQEFDILIGEQIQAQEGYIKKLQTDKASIGELDAAKAEITELIADKASIVQLEAAKAEITDLVADKIDAEVVNAKFATIENLDATNAEITQLKATNVEISGKLTAAEAEIDNLEVNKLSAKDIEGKYANIDFSNIGEAAIKELFSEWGLIRDLVVSNGTITGELIGVTIKGDLIEGGTVIADKLVVKGSDGIYYKLNVEAGATTSEEVTEEELQNGLHGTAIIAKTITAEKIAVDDLVAFDATIGGFKITENSIYSSVKESVGNTTRGSYLDNEGQFAFGDASNFIKYYKTADGSYKLEIATGGRNVDTAIDNAQSTADEALAAANQNASDMASVITEFNSDIENLQTQIDGSITTWFYEVAPTTSNEPAVNWSTADSKNMHLGDLYYDTITGYCYRWQVQNNVYSWQRITDTDVTKALSDAKNAQDTADQKRRVFYTQPTPPYDRGDLWVQGGEGDILRCQTAKVSGQSYVSSDWVVASKYTDDTLANEAIEKADSIYYGGRNLAIGTSNEWTDFSTLNTGLYYTVGDTTDYRHNVSEFNVKSGDCLCFGIDIRAINKPLRLRVDYARTTDGDPSSSLISYNSLYGEYIQIGEEGRSIVTIPIDENSAYVLTMLVSDGSVSGTTVEQYKCFQIEKSSKPTEWKPAPEDVEASIVESIEESEGRTNTIISEQYTNLVTTCEGLVFDATQTLVTESEFETYKTEQELELKATAEEFSLKFDNTKTDIEDVNDDFQRFQETFSKFIKFTGDTAITIGSGGSAITLEIDNETGIIFKKNGHPFGRWDGENFYTGNIVVEVNERAQFGNFAFTPRSDGSLMFLKVGG